MSAWAGGLGRGARGAARGRAKGEPKRQAARQASRGPQPVVARGPQRERHEADYVLLLAVAALAALGVLMVYSSTGVSALLERDDPFAVVGPQAMWAVLGVIVMLVMMRVDYRYLRMLSVPGFAVALVLLVLVLLPPMGPLRPIEVNGASRWLQIGPLPTMHPAEFAKLALVVYLAHWLARRGGRAGSLVHGLLPFLCIVGPVLLLVMLEPDLGTSGVLALTAFTMFFVAGGSLWQLALLLPAGLAAVAVVVLNSGYQLQRVQAFLDPWADAQGIGFHTVQGLLALGSGGLLGIGLGQSRQPGELQLPAAQNDYVFAVVGQELGLMGGLAVIGLFLLLAYRGLRVALGAPDTFGSLLATGITAWLVLQAFVNIGVVVVLIPVTGITLPFLSAGGSSLLVSFAAVGILLSISRETLPRGTWNDADADRRRRYGRPRLPGTGRRPVAGRAHR
ncbi:MAG TPA: putative lipid II flippase FtsW [Candidatus Limnocylindria bacterium]|nr:putative lipid II flippase FtsW [Candidatus Limnocylindria bacterium]